MIRFVAVSGVAIALVALIAVSFSRAQESKGAIHKRAITYKVGDAEFVGTLASPEIPEGEKRPAVLIVHNWMGEKEFERNKAADLAMLGYVAFACDMFGKDVRPKTVAEAQAETGKLYQDRAVLRARVNAALDTLKQQPGVDPARVSAMGFCFGGAVCLELARSGAEVAGVISFHGGLGTTQPAKADTLKARILVLHGADDPYVPAKDIEAFHKEMRDAKADWYMTYFGNSVHSFTEPEAGTDNSKGAAYNAKADARSWKMMKDFLAEVSS